MATTGKVYGSNSADSSAATENWGSIANMNADDGSYATGSGFGDSHGFLYGFDFSASISSGDTINSIEIEVQGYDDYGDGGWAIQVSWTDPPDASNVAADYTSGVTRIPSAGDFGGTSGTPATQTRNMQATLPTADDLLDTNFWIMVRVIDSDSYPGDARVDYVTMNVDYTASGGGGSESTPISRLNTSLFKQFLGR